MGFKLLIHELQNTWALFCIFMFVILYTLSGTYPLCLMNSILYSYIKCTPASGTYNTAGRRGAENHNLPVNRPNIYTVYNTVYTLL